MLVPLLLVTQLPFVDLSGPQEADGLAGVAFVPGSSELLLSHSSSGRVTLLAQDPAASRSLDLGGLFWAPTVAPDGATACVLDPLGETLWVLDLPQLSVRHQVSGILGLAESCLIQPGGQGAVVITGGFQPFAQTVDLASGQVLDTWPLGGFGVTGTPVEAVLAQGGSELLAVGVDGNRNSLYRYALPGGQLLTDVGHDSFLANPTVSRAGDVVAYLSLTPGPAGLDVTLERRTLPGWSALTSLALPSTPYLAGGLVGFDATDEGVVVALEEDLFYLDLTSGSVQPLGVGTVLAAELSGDGETLLACSADDPRSLRALDPSSGQLLTTLRLREALPALAVQGDRAAVYRSYGDGERVELLHVDRAASAYLADRSASAAPQFDGPFDAQLQPGGGTAWIAARDSDSVHQVDLASGAELRRVGTRPQPVQLAPRDTTSLYLLQRQGRSLAVVEPSASPALALQVPLPGEPSEVHPLPGTTRAWVRLESPQPALAEVQTDPAAPGVLQLLPLMGTGDAEALPGLPPPSRSTVALDPARNLAFVVSGGEALFEVLDLSSGQSVASVSLASPPPFGEPAATLRLDSAGTRLFVGQRNVGFSAYDVTLPHQPQLLWSSHYTPLGTGLAGGGIFLTPGGDALIADLFDPTAFPPPDLGALLLDAATGALLAEAPLSGLAGVAYGGDLMALGGVGGLALTRFQGPLAQLLEGCGLPGALGRPVLDPATGRLLQPASLPSGDREGVYLADPAGERTERRCSPAAPNASGQAARLDLLGLPLTLVVLELRVSGLQPGAMAGYLLFGSDQGPPQPVAGSPTPLCASGFGGRYLNQLQLADAAGQHQYLVDTQAAPSSLGPIELLSGTTWTFQAWFRDTDPAGQPRTNLSDALALTLY